MSEKEIIGRFSLHPRGFGFVQSLIEDLEIFIPKRFVDDAIDGDIVKVVYFPENETKKGFEGKISAIVERKRKSLYALIVDKKGKDSYIAHSPVLGSEKPVLIKKVKQKLQIGDRVLLILKKWMKQEGVFYGTFHEKIGNISNPSQDLIATQYEYFLPLEFPESCEVEAQSFGKTIKTSKAEKRIDLSNLECFTIDPTDAKDFDDALSLSFDGREYLLHVHIADVSNYIKPGTALDEEAFARGNSTYLPGKCIPMIPEALSNHLCSLMPNVKRFAVTVEMRLDDNGQVLSYRIYKSIIKSQKRFTYEEAKEVLDGRKKSKFKETLELMSKLCLILKKRRKERGSIDFSMPEIKLIVDEKGKPKSFITIEYDITHQLVEEFMLLANETVASELLKKEKKAIFRVHEDPHEDKLLSLYNYIRSLGYTISDTPTTEELQTVFEKAKNTSHFHFLIVNFIKTMKLAYYSDENVGHYGLSLENYAHFTSPIRRYSDLIVHRALFNEKVGNVAAIAKHISTQERNSFRAESATILVKKLRLLEEYIVKKPNHIYQATITRCKPNGFFFEVDTFFIEGFIHISNIGKDFYIFNPEKEDITGDRTKIRYYVGKPIEVELESIDLVFKECEWLLSKNSK